MNYIILGTTKKYKSFQLLTLCEQTIDLSIAMLYHKLSKEFGGVTFNG